MLRILKNNRVKLLLIQPFCELCNLIIAQYGRWEFMKRKIFRMKETRFDQEKSKKQYIQDFSEGGGTKVYKYDYFLQGCIFFCLNYMYINM